MNDRAGSHGADRTILVDPGVASALPAFARLVAMTDSINPREIVLTPGRTKIGKAPTESPESSLCAISGDGHMSRNHAIIEVEGDRVTIADSKSLNGTLVNGTLVDRAVLRDGDTVQMGESIFRFECAS